PEEDLEEYEDDEMKDGPDEDKEDEEEEEHLALADSAIVIPTVELVSPPERTEPVIPPSSTNTTTTEARITVRLQASISLPPEAEVERLLAMPTPPPSPLTSLSPPSAGERLASGHVASAMVTYTSVYTDSEPGRVFWGADEELSDGGSSRVIVYGYDGLPMQPVAPPSPNYIHGPEEPQIPPVPQDEDEREPMFIQPHDHDYVPEPMYPEYIPLEGKHVLPIEEQPLPPVDTPTVESPGYVAESDPEEDLEEYEDDEMKDGPVDYPMNRGDDGDDDDYTQALIDGVTAELLSPPLPPPLYIPPPIDRRDDIPEIEMPPY
nr:hypothetical protein [Tanacetum cinerariifolium]